MTSPEESGIFALSSGKIYNVLRQVSPYFRLNSALKIADLVYILHSL